MPKGRKKAPSIPVINSGNPSCPHLFWTVNQWDQGTCRQCGGIRQYPSEMKLIQAEGAPAPRRKPLKPRRAGVAS